MIESVVFISRFAVLKLTPDPDSIVISLSVPGDPVTFAKGWRAVLQLEFHDISEETISATIGSIPNAAEEGHLALEYAGNVYRWPDTHHAKAIKSFLAEFDRGCSDFVDVIVHCDMGKSRSAAVAQFVAQRYQVPILNNSPEWRHRVSMTDFSRANPRLFRLLEIC